MNDKPKLVRLRSDLADDSFTSLGPLVNAAREGDSAAWEELYRRSHAKLYRRVRYLAKDAATAQEVTQECFVQAMCSLADYEGRASFDSWLGGIALNIVRKQWRRENVRRRAHAGLVVLRGLAGSPDRAADDEIQSRTEEAALDAAIAELPEKLREVFVLRHLEGASCREIASVLRISESNVAVRAHRARERVKKALERRGIINTKGRSDG